MRVHSIVQKLKFFIQGLLATIKLIMSILTSGVCFNRNTTASVEALFLFIKATKNYYPDNIVTGRSLNKSLELLSALTSRYQNNRSNCTLQQLLLVYQEEFLQRRDNGRK